MLIQITQKIRAAGKRAMFWLNKAEAIRFFLHRRQHTAKIAHVTTFAWAIPQKITGKKPREIQPVKCFPTTFRLAASPGWQHMRFSPRIGDARLGTLSKENVEVVDVTGVHRKSFVSLLTRFDVIGSSL